MSALYHYMGVVLIILLAAAPAQSTLLGSDKVVADSTETALRSLSQAYQMSGLREMTENLSKRYLGEALGKKLPEWAGDAIVSVLSGRKGPGLRERLNDPKMRAEMKAQLSARLQQEIPRLAKSVVIDKLFNGVIAENDPQAKKIIDQMVHGLTTPLNTQADEWAERLYDKAVTAAEPYIKYNLQIGNNSLMLDATDLRGTISRTISMDTVGDIVSASMSEAFGESAYGQIQRRFDDLISGNLPPELARAIRDGPEKIDGLIAQGKSYLPSAQLEALKAKLMAIPVITIPNEVYGGVLAGSAARHFALAFAEFPAVNMVELNRGREVAQVLIWQLNNKQGMNLNVGQFLDLANLALNQAGGLGALGQFGKTIGDVREHVDRMQQQLKELEGKIAKPLDQMSAELREQTQTLEKTLKDFQDEIAQPFRDWKVGVTAGLKEGTGMINGKIPEWLHVPPDWKDFKKQTGIPGKVFGEFGDKDILDHTGIRDAARKANKDASDQLASVLVDAARGLLPKPEITPEEKVPAQNPDENGDYDPVLLHNGEFMHPVVDVTIPGRGLDLQFTRVYRSRSQFVGRLGWNWTHNFEESLQTWVSPMGPGITWVDPSGRKFFFRARIESLGDFESPAGVFAILKTVGRDVEKSFELRKSGGMVARFDRHGFLRETCDRFGNCVRCERDVSGVLRAVVDTVGRRITFDYDTVGRITMLRDVAGRQWQYRYDAHGDLASVTAPATDAYPQGMTTAYYYSSGEMDAAFNHNMTQIRDPKGYIFLKNVYGTTGFARDQIVAQHYGGPQHLVKSRYVLLRPRWLVKAWPDAENIAVDRVDLRDRRGVVKRFWHNAAGNLLRQEIVDAKGRVHAGMRYRYNADGMRVATIQPSGLMLHEEYWQTSDRLLQGLVVKQVLGGQREWQYRYEPRFGEMVYKAEPVGVVTQWHYDGHGARVEKTVSAAANANTVLRTVFEMNEYGQVMRMRDPRNSLTQYDYDGGNRVATIQDADGRRLTTRYVYDAIGNITVITLPNGGVRKFEVDAQNLIRKETTPMGYVRRYDYDAHGNVTAMHVGKWVYRFDYDVLDHLIRRTEPVDELRTATTQYVYDTDGHLLETQFPEGNRTRYTYDAWGHVTAVERGAGTREASFAQYQYDQDGHMVGVMDGLGQLMELERNAFGEVAAVIYPNQARQEMERDAAGRVVGVAWKDRAGTILSSEKTERDALGLYVRDLQWDSQGNTWRETRRDFDAVGNLIQITPPAGAVTRYAYDGLGLRVQSQTDQLTEKWQYNELGLPTVYKFPSPSGRGQGEGEVHYAYDLQGRLVARTDPNGAVSTLAYDDRDNVLQKTPPEGAVVRYDYDGMGRRTVVAQNERITCYDWDGNGRLRTLTDPMGRATHYTYDALDRLLSEEYPDGGVVRMTYDANSRVTKRCQPNGTCVSQAFDVMGNLVAQHANDLRQSFQYDPMGRMIAAQAGDHLSQFVYSSLSEVVASVQGTHHIKMEYDANGARRTMQFENGNRVQWQRDALGRITQVEALSGFRAAQTWGMQGPEKIAYANGRSDVVRYDVMGNVISQYMTGPAAETLLHPDQGGALVEGIFAASVMQYSYNLLGNLISENGTHYIYDPWQQLVQAGHNQWHYNLNGEREPHVALQYDKNGNVIADEKFHYHYDALDRLQEVQDAQGQAVARYFYDALNRRIAKEVNGHRTDYVYDGWEPVEIYEDGKLVTQFVRGDDLDEPFGALANGAPQYYHRDRLGSVVAVSDTEGRITEQLAYDPFGSPSPSGRGQGEGEVQLFRRYTGQVFDPETGLYYMRNRYYSPRLGQFLTRDPLGYKNEFIVPSSLVLPFNLSFHQFLGAASRASLSNQVDSIMMDTNLYASLLSPQNDADIETNLHVYVGNNPTNRVDPLGLYYMRLNRDKNLMYLFTSNGSFVGEWEARTRGSSRNRLESGGDTPNGIYKVNSVLGGETYRHPTITMAVKGKVRTIGPEAYGLGYIGLTPLSIEPGANRRSGLAIHGGGTGKKNALRNTEQGWVNTFGCVRMQNNDIISLVENIHQLESMGDTKGALVVYDGAVSNKSDVFNSSVRSNPRYLPGAVGANSHLLH